MPAKLTPDMFLSGSFGRPEPRNSAWQVGSKHPEVRAALSTMIDRMNEVSYSWDHESDDTFGNLRSLYRTVYKPNEIRRLTSEVHLENPLFAMVTLANGMDLALQSVRPVRALTGTSDDLSFGKGDVDRNGKRLIGYNIRTDWLHAAERQFSEIEQHDPLVRELARASYKPMVDHMLAYERYYPHQEIYPGEMWALRFNPGRVQDDKFFRITPGVGGVPDPPDQYFW